MESQKQVIIPGIVSIAVFSLLFFMVRDFYKEQYDITQKELQGIEKISIMHNVTAMIKHNMFLSEIEPNIKNQIKENSFIPNSNILEELEKVNSTKFKDLSKNKLNDEYILILKKLEDEKFYLADKLSLFLEPQRDIASLISIALRIMPEALNNIENLSKIELGALSVDKAQEYNKFIIDDAINKFLSNFENISKNLMNISITDSSPINLHLDNAMSEFKALQIIILNVQHEISEQTSVDYFLKLSKIYTSLDSLFVSTKELLIDKLQERENNIGFKIKNGTYLYTILVILTLIAMYINYYKSKKLLKDADKKKDEDNYIATLKETLLESSSLKSVCEMSIKQLVERFDAISGILYIYDDNNYKLYLGGTYGIDPVNIDCTLCIHDNLIGDCIIDHQLKITHSDLELNDGNKKIKVHELVSIPLVNLDKSIGAVQLYFSESFDQNEIDFLKRVIYIMSNNIYQAEQENQTDHYLKLIDKNIMVIKSDLNGDILDVSEEFCNLSGYTRDELIGQNHRLFQHKDTPQILYTELWNNIKKGLVWRGEIKNRTKTDGYYWADNIIVPNMDINGNITGYTGIKHDITNRKLVEELSITDSLTNLYNRRYFDEIFEKKLLIALREDKKVALTILDIDYFKQYNDTYGHQSGDKALIDVANIIKSIMSRPNDYCFRIGGEEFAMLCFYYNENSVVEFSDKVRRTIENLKIIHSGNYSSKYLTVSMGVKFIKDEELKSAEKAFKAADKALYEAKNSGRNRVVVV